MSPPSIPARAPRETSGTVFNKDAAVRQQQFHSREKGKKSNRTPKPATDETPEEKVDLSPSAFVLEITWSEGAEPAELLNPEPYLGQFIRGKNDRIRFRFSVQAIMDGVLITRGDSKNPKTEKGILNIFVPDSSEQWLAGIRVLSERLFYASGSNARNRIGFRKVEIEEADSTAGGAPKKKKKKKYGPAKLNLSDAHRPLPKHAYFSMPKISGAHTSFSRRHEYDIVLKHEPRR